jgi:hypothetical protein
LLREALTHRSAAQGRARQKGAGSNERLEFVGDRVLGLVIAEWLVERFPHEQEGQLGPRHAQLVSREALADIGTRNRVVCAFGLTIDSLAPAMRLSSVDFPAFGAPSSATKPHREAISRPTGAADPRRIRAPPRVSCCLLHVRSRRRRSPS